MINQTDTIKKRYDNLLTVSTARNAEVNELLDKWNEYSSMLLQFRDWCSTTTVALNAIIVFPDFLYDFSTVLEKIKVLIY